GRFRLPALVGLFVAGALIGPNGFAFIKETEQVRALAEVGVVFLLFTLGLEFSFRKMIRLGRVLLVAGPIQAALTGVMGALIAWALGASGRQAVVLGMLIALSSTAVVLKTLDERAELATPVGRCTLGILIFQDVLVVPLMILLPLLAGDSPEDRWNPLLLAASAVGVVIAVIVAAKWIAPWLLREAARTRNADVFLMTVVTICFAVAALSAEVGLSLALGAFLAGLIISESEYSHQALGYVLPFRNLLVSFFFVSVGMLLDLQVLAHKWWIVLLGTAALLIFKTLTGTLAVLALRYPLRVAFVTGSALSQVGEFSFVLAAVAAQYNLLGGDLQQEFLAVAVLTMAVTPIIMTYAPRLGGLLHRLPLPPRLSVGHPLGVQEEAEVSDHLLIIGFGINGRNLARAAREVGIPYVVIEMNPDTVRKETVRGEPLY
ncbi:MAG: cation:proton antiporter, partial [Thermoleophilia bacterium]|nr:cation:proton antiporter [Thermoleophilia bacterium]